MNEAIKQRRVVIAIFDDVEVLDFAGPFEVFSVAGRRQGLEPFEVLLVAQEMRLIKARNNFMVMPHFSLADCPPSDLFLIPGGGGRRADGAPFGTRFEKDNPVLLEWIKERHRSNELTLSVCSGSLILASAGLLEGLPATSHRGALQELRDISPNVQVIQGRKTVDAGRIVTSGGISAGIDMALDVVAKLHGLELARETAYYMEYDWEPSV